MVAVLAMWFFTQTAFGATIGVKLAENYDPYIRYNGGYYSLLPVQASQINYGSQGASISHQVSVGTCNTASSSAFDIPNPYAATSTATLSIEQLGQEATSTTINVGTTTLASGLTSSNPGLTLAAGAVQATSSQATLVSGQTLGLGSGQISAGAGSVSKIVVGPSENVGEYATSTYGNAGALNYTPPSCVYKITWES